MNRLDKDAYVPNVGCIMANMGLCCWYSIILKITYFCSLKKFNRYRFPIGMTLLGNNCLMLMKSGSSKYFN